MNNLSILPNNNIADDPPAPPPAPPISRPQLTYANVKVVDIEMSFGSMVIFMIKWAFATIPAVIAVFGIFLIILAVLSGGGYGLGSLIK